MNRIADDDRRVAIYTRVSSDEQALRGESLAEQEAVLQRYCEGMGWRVVDVYQEDGRSGKDLNRPEYGRMMGDAEAGRVNTVLVKKIDRLSRSLLDFERIIIEYDRLGVDLVSREEKFETANPLSAAFIRIIMVFAQLEREQIAKRTADVAQYRLSIGLPNGGWPLLGYTHQRVEGKGGPWQIVPEEAEVVREIFRTYLLTASLEKTSAELNQRGFRTKSWKTKTNKDKGGKRWTKNHVRRLLTNPTYVGKLRGRNGVLHPGQHEPIIDETTFTRVQEMLTQNAAGRGSSRTTGDHVYLLRGLIKCGACNRAMAPSFSAGRDGAAYYYYRCGNDFDRSQKACPIKSVNAAEAESAVIHHIRDLANDPEIVEDTVGLATDRLRQSSVPQKKAVDALRRNLGQVKRKIDGVVTTMTDLDNPARRTALTSLVNRLRDLEEQQDQLEKELVVAERKFLDLQTQEISADRLVSNLKVFGRVWNELSRQEQFDLLHSVVKEIVYHSEDVGKQGHRKKRGRIDLYLWDIPVLEEDQGKSAAKQSFAARSIWLLGRDSNPRPDG